MHILIDAGSKPAQGERRDPGLKDKEEAASSRSTDRPASGRDSADKAKEASADSFDGHMSAAAQEESETQTPKTAPESSATHAENTVPVQSALSIDLKSRPDPQLRISQADDTLAKSAHNAEMALAAKTASGKAGQKIALLSGAVSESAIKLDGVLPASEGETVLPSDVSEDGLRKVLGDRLESRSGAFMRNGEAAAATIKLAAGSSANAAGVNTAAAAPDFMSDAGLPSLDDGAEVMLGKSANSAPGAVNNVSAVMQVAASAAPAAATQIVAAIKADRAGNTIEVRLDPPEMGRVRIDFTMETAEAVKAVLTAERPETLEHLRRNTDDLLAQLKQAGFSQIDLEFSGNGASEFEESSRAPSQDGGFTDDDRSSGTDMIYLSLRDSAQLDLLV